jgi:hypothetical protein
MCLHGHTETSRPMTHVIEHKIPLKEEAKPFRQKLRQINPMLLPVMEKEVKKLLDA